MVRTATRRAEKHAETLPLFSVEAYHVADRNGSAAGTRAVTVSKHRGGGGRVKVLHEELDGPSIVLGAECAAACRCLCHSFPGADRRPCIAC